MPTRDTAWPAGTPNWVDCSFDDLDGARNFYGKLFGWVVDPGPEEYSGYTMCMKHGKAAAALAPRPDESVPSMWSTFFATDDVGATVATVREAGGTVVYDAMDVGDAGRMAFFLDPEGASFGVWQGKGHHGFGIYNEPGAVGWNDLMTRNLDAAKAFYTKVFGFTYEEMGPDYAVCKRADDGQTVCGMHVANEMPADVLANWLTHFVVADRDTAISLVEELHGEVLMSFDTPFGPEAVVRGPEGEVFNVIAFKGELQGDAEETPQS